VQDVLVATKAIRGFRNPDVAILRPTGNVVEPTLKLACNFNSKADKVSLETDYAVLPGDRVVVQAGPAVSVSQLFSSILGR
jgi:hypothetical protein